VKAGSQFSLRGIHENRAWYPIPYFGVKERYLKFPQRRSPMEVINKQNARKAGFMLYRIRAAAIPLEAEYPDYRFH
jgi:hypothetical protein